MWERYEQYLLHKTLTIRGLLRQCQNTYFFTFSIAFLRRFLAQHPRAIRVYSIAQKSTLVPTYDIEVLQRYTFELSWQYA
jgi:hypothetical protein